MIHALDKKGNLVVVNTKKNNVKIGKDGTLSMSISEKGDFQLLSEKESKKAEQKILKTVTPAKKSQSVAEGKKTKFNLSAKCNKDNISKITYKTDNKNAKVDKKGNITAKASGSTTVTAVITLKNGTKKEIKMKIKVK